MKKKDKIMYILAILIFGLVLLRKSELVNIYKIQEAGMDSQLKNSRYVMTSSLKEPSRLDIVIVKTIKYDPKVKIVSRLVGLPGDTLVIADGALFVNGENQDNLFGLEPNDTTSSDTVIVRKGRAYIMGDNRKASFDSRHFGQIFWEEIVSSEL